MNDTFLVLKWTYTIQNKKTVLKNYFKITIRTLWKSKTYTFINVFGLTVGIACFSLILLFVENELSFDQFHSNQSYRFLINEQTGDGESRTKGRIDGDTHDAFAENIAGIEDVILLQDYGAGPLLVAYKDVKFKSRSMLFAEEDFFDYFDFKMIQGDPKTALNDPNNVVLTKSTAEKIFGNANPIGEFIKYSGSMNFTLQVTGVIEDINNSHMDFDFLMNYDLRDDSGYILMREGFVTGYGYYKFAGGVEPSEMSLRTKTYVFEMFKDDPEMLELLAREDYEFQPVQDIYFDSNHVVLDDGFRKGNKQNIIVLSGIGLFMLLIACMNYINAATAKAINRKKEIGVRKVFGAFRIQLISQFMGEAFLIALIAVLCSILLTDVALPFFENVMETTFRYSLLSNPLYFTSLTVVLILVTLFSGTYPALVLSNYKPSEKAFLKGSGLRTLLVGVQLFITMVLVSSILFIVKQTNYVNDKALGFSKEDILIIPNNSEKVSSQLSTYKNELLKSPYIYNATAGMDVLGFESTNNSGRVILEGETMESAPRAAFFTVGMDFIDIQDIEVIAGRGFNEALVTDSTAIIVNEAYVRAVGIDDIVGKKARLWSTETAPKTIIGVVKDFNFKSLHSKVSPAIFVVNKNRNWFWTVKIDPENKQLAVTHAKNAWDSIEPNYPFGSMFLEDNLDNYYGEEKRLQSAIWGFSAICIFISCLGLYGMTAFTLERKTKEIGIRKVLGAPVSQLVWMINSKFIKILLVSGLLAIPLVVYAINLWFEGFAYHTNVDFFTFLITGISVAVIVIATVSGQAVRAAWANPTKTLSHE